MSFENKNKVTERELDANLVSKINQYSNQVEAKIEDFIVYAADWSETSPYTQEIELEFMTANLNGYLQLHSVCTVQQMQACKNALIDIQSQGEHKLVLKCDGVIPAVDIPMRLIYGNIAVLTSSNIENYNQVNAISIGYDDLVDIGGATTVQEALNNMALSIKVLQEGS